MIRFSNSIHHIVIQSFANAYDGLGRSVIRDADVFAYDVRGDVTAATWTVVGNRSFVYDNWNLIYERSERPSEGAA